MVDVALSFEIQLSLVASFYNYVSMSSNYPETLHMCIYININD